MNNCAFIGRLTRDPDMKFTGNGIAVTTFTLAIDRPYKSQNGDKETDFIDIVAWRQLAEHCANYLTKGRLVAVQGRLEIQTYEAKDGSKRKAAKIVANNVQFLDGKTERQSAGATDDLGQEVDYGTDIPF